MNKLQMISYLMTLHSVSYRVAEDACIGNEWNFMMASDAILDLMKTEF